MDSRLKHSKLLIISSAFIASNSFAAPPTAYDNWSITGGAIDTSASCADVNITCKTIVEEGNFKYEELTYKNPLTNGPKKSYLRLIITDAPDGNPTNLNFSSESFVPFSIVNRGVDQGLAVKQYVRDPLSNFQDIAEIQKGFLRLNPEFVPAFVPGGNPASTPIDESFTTKLDQSFGDATLDSKFSYLNFTQFRIAPAPSTPDTNTVIGQKVDIDQKLNIGNPTQTDKQQLFVFRQANGYKGTHDPTTGGIFDVNYHFNAPLTTLGDLTLEKYTQAAVPANNNYDGSIVSWANTDNIAVTWIAQSDNIDFGAGATGAAFAYQSVANRTAATSARERYLNFVDGDLADPINPFDWDVANLGAVPTY